MQVGGAALPPLTSNDIPQLLQLLLAALSSETNAQKQAEAVLASLEQRTGYCACLAAIVQDSGSDHSARWLASVQLKNTISKYWRPRYDSSGISSGEKAHLRRTFLTIIPQDDNKIAIQVALNLAKVARFDFPREWPTLFSELLSGLPNASTLVVRRTYLVLHHVLKELASKRLVADQKNFAEVTNILFDHIWSQWCSDLQTILSLLSESHNMSNGATNSIQQTASNQQLLLLHFERWLLLLKILRRLVLNGFPSDARSLQPVGGVDQVAPGLLQALMALQQVAPAAGAAAVAATAIEPGGLPRVQLAAMADRGVVKLVKTLHQIQDVHPWSYKHAGVLIPSMELCYNQLLSYMPDTSSSSSGSSSREDLLVQCGMLMLGVLQCPGYQGRTGSILTTSKDKERAALIKQLGAEATECLKTFWSAASSTSIPDVQQLLASTNHQQQQQTGSEQQQQRGGQGQRRLAALTTALLLHYMPLTVRELGEWEADAEAFYHAMDVGSNWQDSLRGCAQHLLLVLLTSYRSEVAPLIVQQLTAASSSCPSGAAPKSLPGPHLGSQGLPLVLLRKEAMYRAVALGAYELVEAIDYPGWLRSTLLQEMTNSSSPSSHPLCWACAKVIREWVPQLPASDRPATYAALAQLLGQEDMCLRLSGVAALRQLVDDFGFEGPQLLPYVPQIMAACQAMLADSEELDTQTQVFTLINLLLERLGPDIKPQIGLLVTTLPQVWQGAEGQSLLRIQVLSALQLLLNVLGSESEVCYELLLPLLAHSLDAEHNGEPELMEDGLVLWLVALRNAVRPCEQLMQLTQLLVPALVNSTEHIALGMQLFTSLILLGGGPFLAQYGSAIASVIENLLGQVKERGMLLMMPVMDLLLVCYPQEAPQLLAQPLQKLLMLLLSGSESSVVVANALGLYARLLLLNPVAFQELLISAATAGVRPSPGYKSPHGLSLPEQLLGCLLELWCDSFDAIAVPIARKLAALGLAAMLGVPSRVVLGPLGVIVSHVTGVWCEVERSGEDAEEGVLYCSPLYSTTRSDEDGLGGEGLIASEEAAGEAARREQVREHEPLRKVKISVFLRQQLEGAMAIHGQEFAAAMGKMDPSVAQQLQAMMAGAAAGQHQQQRRRT